MGEIATVQQRYKATVILVLFPDHFLAKKRSGSETTVIQCYVLATCISITDAMCCVKEITINFFSFMQIN